MSKVWLVLCIVSGGIDSGPPPIQVATMEECQSIAASILQRGILPGVDLVRVGCLQEVGGNRS